MISRLWFWLRLLSQLGNNNYHWRPSPMMIYCGTKPQWVMCWTSEVNIMIIFDIISCSLKWERSSGWLPWSSLETLKASFNISMDDQGSHTDDISVSVSNKLWIQYISMVSCQKGLHMADRALLAGYPRFHEKYTQFWSAMFCHCVIIFVLYMLFVLSIYPYSSGMPYWHLANYIIIYPTGSELTQKDRPKWSFTKNYKQKLWLEPCAYFRDDTVATGRWIGLWIF